MNCPECERLLDAYLDGHLGGALRLEFDAHRVRCPRCQQMLALAEAIGHVLASDTQAPQLREDFTDRVITQITTPAPRVIPFPTFRVALLAAAVVQVAALVTFALLWRTDSGPAGTAPAATALELSGQGVVERPDREMVYSSIVEGVEDRFWEMHAAGRQLTTDLLNLARYLEITLPADFVRESTRIVGVNPWQALWDTLRPSEPEEPETPLPEDGVQSI